MTTLDELNAAIDRLEYLALARAENANDRNDARSAAERAHAAINALPGLIESARRVERLEAEMGRTERNRDMWKSQVERQSEVISIMRNALKEIAGSPSHGAGCNPEGFVSIARTALKGT